MERIWKGNGGGGGEKIVYLKTRLCGNRWKKIEREWKGKGPGDRIVLDKNASVHLASWWGNAEGKMTLQVTDNSHGVSTGRRPSLEDEVGWGCGSWWGGLKEMYSGRQKQNGRELKQPVSQSNKALQMSRVWEYKAGTMVVSGTKSESKM